MKYETPELTALTPAINAIQSHSPKIASKNFRDTVSNLNEATASYADWE